MVNLSENHRKILGALYDLHGEFPNREGFTQREIASGAGVSPQTVSNNKTFLVTSAKLLKETEYGLTLPEGAEPSWWSTDGLSTGLPTPEQVRSWWDDSPPDQTFGDAGHAGQATETSRKQRTLAKNSVHEGVGQALDAANSRGGSTGGPLEPNGRIQPLSSEELDSENGLGKQNNGEERVLSSASSVGASTLTRASKNLALIADDDEGVNV